MKEPERPILNYSKPRVQDRYPIRNVILPLVVFVLCFLSMVIAFAWRLTR